MTKTRSPIRVVHDWYSDDTYIDGDRVLADYIASIPPGTPTLKQQYAALRATAPDEFPEVRPARRRATREVGP